MSPATASQPPAILLAGPTASGKSLLALDIAARLPCEIISVDSALVFRDMDVGTAKPSAEDQARVPHHLIDLISPEASYSAARFRTDALAAMADITARGRIPLLVGGTMLYIKALREGLADLPEADPATRAQLDQEAEAHGWPALHAELSRCDPDTAARLAPMDAQRIQRALEVFRVSGRPLSVWLRQSRTAELPYTLLPLALLPSDRAELHRRIAMRFDAMLEAGLIDELRQLRARYHLDPELPSMRCVGYRQTWQHLDGEFDAKELRARGIYATRQLAKRQLTWLRGMDDFACFDCLDAATPSGVLTRIENFVAKLAP